MSDEDYLDDLDQCPEEDNSPVAATASREEDLSQADSPLDASNDLKRTRGANIIWDPRTEDRQAVGQQDEDPFDSSWDPEESYGEDADVSDYHESNKSSLRSQVPVAQLGKSSDEHSMPSGNAVTASNQRPVYKVLSDLPEQKEEYTPGQPGAFATDSERKNDSLEWQSQSLAAAEQGLNRQAINKDPQHSSPRGRANNNLMDIDQVWEQSRGRAMDWEEKDAEVLSQAYTEDNFSDEDEGRSVVSLRRDIPINGQESSSLLQENLLDYAGSGKTLQAEILCGPPVGSDHVPADTTAHEVGETAQHSNRKVRQYKVEDSADTVSYVSLEEHEAHPAHMQPPQILDLNPAEYEEPVQPDTDPGEYSYEDEFEHALHRSPVHEAASPSAAHPTSRSQYPLTSEELLLGSDEESVSCDMPTAEPLMPRPSPSQPTEVTDRSTVERRSVEENGEQARRSPGVNPARLHHAELPSGKYINVANEVRDWYLPKRDRRLVRKRSGPAKPRPPPKVWHIPDGPDRQRQWEAITQQLSGKTVAQAKANLGLSRKIVKAREELERLTRDINRAKGLVRKALRSRQETTDMNLKELIEVYGSVATVFDKEEEERVMWTLESLGIKSHEGSQEDIKRAESALQALREEKEELDQQSALVEANLQSTRRRQRSFEGLQATLAMFSVQLRDAKLERHKAEKIRQKEEGKLRLLSTHIEKLVTYIKHEAIAKVRAQERARNVRRELRALRQRSATLLEGMHAREERMIALRESSRLLEDQLRLMDHRFLEFRGKLDYARNSSQVAKRQALADLEDVTQRLEFARSLFPDGKIIPSELKTKVGLKARPRPVSWAPGQSAGPSSGALPLADAGTERTVAWKDHGTKPAGKPAQGHWEYPSLVELMSAEDPEPTEDGLWSRKKMDMLAQRLKGHKKQLVKTLNETV